MSPRLYRVILPVPDIDAAAKFYSRLFVTPGATMTKKPQMVVRGGYSGYFKDPDGHLWQLAYNPFMWVGPEDGEC